MTPGMGLSIPQLAHAGAQVLLEVVGESGAARERSHQPRRTAGIKNRRPFSGEAHMDGQRCDRCCQRATARLNLDTGGVLYFCSHHTRVLFSKDLDLEFWITYETMGATRV